MVSRRSWCSSSYLTSIFVVLIVGLGPIVLGEGEVIMERLTLDQAEISKPMSGSRWVQRGGDIDGEAAEDWSGDSVSLSADGSVLAVGAPFNDGNGRNSGHVRVYTWNGSEWVQRGGDIDGEAAEDQSGYSVSLSVDGSVLAVGAPRNDGNGDNSGHVRVYTWNGSRWVQRGGDIDGEAAGDYSGSFVSLSADGSVLAVGAPYNDGNGYEAGHVRVYAWNGSRWVQRGADIDSEAAENLSGDTVSLSADGSVLAVGAPFNDGNGYGYGHVRVYTWNGSEWVQRGGDIDGEAAGDWSGKVSLSADGSVLAVGTAFNNGNGKNSGHVRVYTWDGSEWVQRGADIDGEAAEDRSGYSVSLSADGSVLAVGAPSNEGNGDRSGHVRVYAWNGSRWVQQGGDIDGEAAGDWSGEVSLSADGSVLAVGANRNDGSGIDAGHVRVYVLE